MNLVSELVSNDVADEKIRSIVEGFLFSMAMSFDDGVIRDKKIGDKGYYPTICFRDAWQVEEAKEITIPDGADAFHETVPFGVIEEMIESEEGDMGCEYDV